METEYIATLEKEIKSETYILETRISHKNWVQAGLQQRYLEGLYQALHLAMTYIVKKEKG